MAQPTVFAMLEEELHGMLAAPPELANGRVWRGRQVPVVKEHQTAINVRLDKSIAESGGVSGSPTDWISDFDVEIYARGDADAIATDLVDALLAAVYERLAFASTAMSLLALGVQDVLPNPQIQWDRGDANQSHVAAILSVRIVHRTRPGQLRPWS